MDQTRALPTLNSVKFRTVEATRIPHLSKGPAIEETFFIELCHLCSEKTLRHKTQDTLLSQETAELMRSP